MHNLCDAVKTLAGTMASLQQKKGESMYGRKEINCLDKEWTEGRLVAKKFLSQGKKTNATDLAEALGNLIDVPMTLENVDVVKARLDGFCDVLFAIISRGI